MNKQHCLALACWPLVFWAWLTLAAGTALSSHAYDLRYDAVGQLRQATLDGDEASAGSGVWTYDAAGNRTGIQAGGGTLSTATPTATNALLSLRGGGRVRVAGTLSEWAQVTVNGQAASPTAGGTSFEAFVPLPSGSQTLSISATDASGNVGTSRYQLTISAGAGLDFGYDDNGNTTALTPTEAGSAAAQSFEWNARDEVTAIVQGGHRTELGYDGQGNRVRLTEKENGVVVSDRLFVDHEERDAATGTVVRRFFAQGEQRVGGADAGSYFYARDHLGSVREMTDSPGTVRASYGYGVWGERSKLRGNLETEAGFTGYWHHAPSGLELSPTRLYHAGLGRFLSQDPLQEGGGQLNLFAYCANDPVNLSDPSGLISSAPEAEAATAFMFGDSAAGARAAAEVYAEGDAAVAALARKRAADLLRAAGLGALLFWGSDTPCNGLDTRRNDPGQAPDGSDPNAPGHGNTSEATPESTPPQPQTSSNGAGARGGRNSAFIHPGKFGYLFGNASGRDHNIQRTAENAAQLARIGVHDDSEGRLLLQAHFDQVVNSDSNIIRSYSNQWGNFEVRESIFAGPGGFIKFESTWQVMGNGSYRFSTAIPFGGP